MHQGFAAVRAVRVSPSASIRSSNSTTASSCLRITMRPFRVAGNRRRRQPFDCTLFWEEAALVETSWAGIMANAFDTEHILAVHQRALREPPQITQLGAHGIELHYSSRVTGRGASDRAMKWLSNDRIMVTIRCWGGTIMTVRSDVGRRIGRLLVVGEADRQRRARDAVRRGAEIRA